LNPRNPAVPYLAPFLAFIAVMGVERLFGVPAGVAYPLRVAVTLGVLVAFSRPALSAGPSSPWLSVALGAVVFAIWIGPDLLFGPAYRHSAVFENSLTGKALSSIPPELRGSVWFLALRTLSCTLLVPPIEELFWRGWLMRWLIQGDFLKIPLGTYQTAAFWIVAVMFAAEHGPYWEVGLVTGLIYNWWMVRTRNLADCIIAHAVTNGLLSAYILYTGQYQYWL
jgi:uncharacterized protein